MERIDLGQPFTAIVDFAHTPNALRVAISTIKKISRNKIIIILGSAGLRDKAKRRIMAEIAIELADMTIFTAEDPRTESLKSIIEDMESGAIYKGGVKGKTYFLVPDRGEAIRLGIRIARAGDIVMACGKGHEQSMCFGSTEYPWDDRIAMQAALSDLMKVNGPRMPYLPTQENPG
jgi:UDP-N-acetylmuramoyl-L-alanyl-D-glutamate--2,6-diaminopimelate ligase